MLADPGAKAQLPARSTAQLTMPDEFELTTASRSAPTSPTGSRHASPEPLLGEAVKNFAKTPGRFRSRPASARETWGAPTFSASKPRTITRSKSFAFESDRRPARPPPKSSAQLEAEALAAVPKFRAQKVSKRVLESSGDVGVPRVQRPPPTQFAEFNLSGIGSMAKRRPSDAGLSSTSVTSVSSEPARTSFKARPMPTYKASGLKAQTPRRMTRPQSPKFVTSQRAATRPPPTAPTEAFATFKARPVPSSASKSSRASVGAFAEPRPVTTPRPFNLSGVERHDMAKAARERQLADEAAAAEKARKFAARKAPKAAAWKPEPSKAAPLVEAKPFNLSTNERGDFFKAEEARRAAHSPTPTRPPVCATAPISDPAAPAPAPSVQEENRRQQKLEEQRKRAFVAKPARVLAKTAFVPAKSTKPLTEINGFQQGSDSRAAKRAAWEAAQAEKAAEAARLAKEAADLKAAEEEAELKALRANMVHKPRDASVLKKKPFALKAPPQRTTLAESPALSTKMRSAVRA